MSIRLAWLSGYCDLFVKVNLTSKAYLLYPADYTGPSSFHLRQYTWPRARHCGPKAFANRRRFISVKDAQPQQIEQLITYLAPIQRRCIYISIIHMTFQLESSYPSIAFAFSGLGGSHRTYNSPRLEKMIEIWEAVPGWLMRTS